jgi:hypothetical protein
MKNKQNVNLDLWDICDWENERNKIWQIHNKLDWIENWYSMLMLIVSLVLKKWIVEIGGVFLILWLVAVLKTMKKHSFASFVEMSIGFDLIRSEKEIPFELLSVEKFKIITWSLFLYSSDVLNELK